MAEKIILTDAQKEELTLIGNLYRESIYSEHNLPNALKKFENLLESQGKDISQTIATEVLRYNQLIENRDLFATLRKWISQLYDLLKENLPDDVSFTIECRRKGLQSTIRKILKNYLEGTSIDLFDLLAFRIIIDSLDNLESQKECCYTVAEICKGFFKSKKCILCTPGKKIANSGLIKDYILNPKSNGYQSLHLAFKLIDNNVVEVQIRTLEMHNNAEYGDGGVSHNDYKDLEYALVTPYIYIEPEKIHIPHFRIMKDGSVFDGIGLINALPIEMRSKTF